MLEVEVGVDAGGKLLGLKAGLLHDLGAYAGPGTALTTTITNHLICAYRIPAFRADVDLVYTNACPTGFIRGGGREVGNFAIERTMDQLASRLGIDPVESRCRNVIRADEMPYDTKLPGVVYDGGDYAELLDGVVAAADYETLRSDATRGVSVVLSVERNGIGAGEEARVTVHPDGTVDAHRETGAVEMVHHVIGHDSGRSINPLLMEGQLHGGFAHGVSYALLEEAVYLPDGSFVTPSFLDYLIAGPPEVAVALEMVKVESEAFDNPESFKGAGESATIPAAAAIVGAVEDAIRKLGSKALINEIPMTPEQLLRAIQGTARARRSSPPGALGRVSVFRRRAHTSGCRPGIVAAPDRRHHQRRGEGRRVSRSCAGPVAAVARTLP